MNPDLIGIVEKNKLWPAIKFNCFQDLLIMIKSSAFPQPDQVCQVLESEYEAILKSMKTDQSLNNSYGVVYLIGRANVGPPTLAIFNKNGMLFDVDEINLFSFQDHFMEMEAGRGEHCGSIWFQSAYKLALDQLERDVNSEKTCDDIEYTDLARMEILRKKKRMPSDKTCYDVEYSAMRCDEMKEKK